MIEHHSKATGKAGPTTRRGARRRARYAAVGVPAAFLAAPTSKSAAGINVGHVLGNLGDAGGQLFAQQPLLATVFTVGAGAAGYMKFRDVTGGGNDDDGFATRKQLSKHMGRRALLKRRAVLRPSLASVPARRVPTDQVGTYLGKDRRTGVRVYAPIEDSTLMFAPMGSGKTAKLGNWVLDAPGAVVVTSTKYDIVELTEELRAEHGRCWLFNPQGLAGRPSDLLWDPVMGCRDPETAMRRARYLLEGSDATKGIENRSFWQTSSYRVLKAFMWAADVEGLSLVDVARWAKQPHSTPALDIFDKHSDIAPAGWADDLRQVQEVKGKPTTTENVFGTLGLTFEFLSLPQVADTVTAAHRPGAQGFDVQAFVASGRDTVYLLGRDDDLGGVGPLFSCLVGEIYEAGRAAASMRPGGRLDPPLSFPLDEAALICPVPLQKWTADSRGLGMAVHGVFQSPAQVVERYGKFAYQTMWDNVTKLILGGLSNSEHLSDLSTLCGVKTVKVTTHSTSSGGEGKGHSSTSHTTREQPVMRPDEIKDLPVGQILVLRRSLKPVVVQFEPVWDRPDVKAITQARKKAARADARARKRGGKVKQAAAPAGNPWGDAPAVAQDVPGLWAPPAEVAAVPDDASARPRLQVVKEQAPTAVEQVPPPRPEYDPTAHLATPPAPAPQPHAVEDDDAKDLGAF